MCLSQLFLAITKILNVSRFALQEAVFHLVNDHDCSNTIIFVAAVGCCCLCEVPHRNRNRCATEEGLHQESLELYRGA